MMKYSRILFVGILFFFVSVIGHSEEPASNVEINGDKVEYSVTENKVTASGNVIVEHNGVSLYCDKMIFDRGNNVGTAEGNVVLVRKEGRFTGDKMIYNFDTMKGDFVNAQVLAKPFHGAGTKISKEGENHIILHNGYITTCDFDEPHFRMQAQTVDIYQNDKAVAHNMTVKLGNMPILFIPRFTQSLKENRPTFILTPGYKKDWGSFILSQYRYYINDDVKATLHLDYRASKGLGEGADLSYNSRFGKGLVQLYYTDEANNDRKFFFQPTSTPTTYRERFRGSWRQKWEIDPATTAIWQYYRISDPSFLKDYFKREYDQDAIPPTYFLLTHGLAAGTVSIQATERVNRFASALDRLPEINYLLPSKQILDTGFYLKNNTTFTSLMKADPVPSSNLQETMRFDIDNEISYPFTIDFLEFRPFVGGRETYYSKAVQNKDDNAVRGIFRTGSDVSTKFFKVYDVHTNVLGLDINRLRHIVTPGIAYFYTHDPTVATSKLVQYDSVDAQSRSHGITFSLENKLQTKREGKSVDLLRLLLSSDFFLKEDTRKGGFNNVTSKMDFNPNKWLALYSESTYDTIEEHLSLAHFDLYLNEPQGRWYASIGKRYDREVDDQVTTEFGVRLNPKWYFKVYDRIDVDRGILREEEYSFVRDLHEWEMKVTFNHKRESGDEIWMVFTLKDFPDLALDFGTGFNRIKPGGQ